MISDFHLHTNFSGDSDASAKDMIERAAALGMTSVCITDHLDYDYPDIGISFLLDIKPYIETLCLLREEYRDRIKLLFGIELGLQPHLAAQYKTLVSKLPLDFVIGSSHLVHGQDPYFPEFFKNRTEQESYGDYFSSVLTNLNAFSDMDVYGHLDYIVRYGPNKNKYYSCADYADTIDLILKTLITKGCGLELNTAGFRCGLSQPNPHPDIIKRYAALGGEIITIGSDAHKPEHLGSDFSMAAAVLKECGFRYYTVFENRCPSFLPL